jgi:hypothetical protein
MAYLGSTGTAFQVESRLDAKTAGSTDRFYGNYIEQPGTKMPVTEYLLIVKKDPTQWL